LLFGTIFTPDDPLLAVHIGNQAKKRAVDKSGQGKKPGPVTEPDLCKYAGRQRSAAEEQPQQNNDRYRHAEQPEQDSSSHLRLHEIIVD
jgi:hypothetical protein